MYISQSRHPTPARLLANLKFLIGILIFSPLLFSCSRVRTLYACLAENEGELSFEPNQIIINGESFLHLWSVGTFYLLIGENLLNKGSTPGINF